MTLASTRLPLSAKEGPGICRQLCDGSQVDNCTELGWSDRSECVPYNSGTLPMCEEVCHPLADDCAQHEGCYWAYRNFYCGRFDPIDSEGAQGDACYLNRACQPGLACVAAENTPDCEADYCCTSLCDLAGPDDCPDGSSCRPFPYVGWDEQLEPDPSWSNVGACSVE